MIIDFLKYYLRTPRQRRLDREYVSNTPTFGSFSFADSVGGFADQIESAIESDQKSDHPRMGFTKYR